MIPLRPICVFVLGAACATSATAQSIEDGLMMPKHGAMLGAFYAHDRWSEYWEGTLKRNNGNIGTLTTQSTMAVAGYGISRKLTLIATLPYVWTHASQGVLVGMRGIQDVTLAAKYKVFGPDSSGRSGLSGFAVVAAATPASSYTPDFMPLSIGTGGSRASGRVTLGYQTSGPWFAVASGAYTFCNNVKLDRYSYYTNGQLYETNQVAMPNVASYGVAAGYRHGRLQIPVSLVLQRTLGGDDIRRQDMPFVSDRMDFTRLGAEAMYWLDAPGNVSLRLGAARVLQGRNVGQSTTLTSGFVYAFHL